MNDPFAQAEGELKEAGYSLDDIPEYEHNKHLWADGILLLWHRHKRLPTADELAEDMFDEWDDPVSDADAERIIELLKGNKR